MPELERGETIFDRKAAEIIEGSRRNRTGNGSHVKSMTSAEQAAGQRQRYESEAASRRGLPPLVWSKTFESFIEEPGMALALRAVKKLMSSSPGNPLVLLSGSYGVGKTHLMYAACNRCREMNWPYKFIRTVDLMSEIKSAISESKRDPEAWPPERIIASYQGDFLLCLDDFGKHQATEYADASIFDIIDARYMLARPTIITTNMDPKTFMDGAIYSRLKPGMVACGGKDMRSVYER